MRAVVALALAATLALAPAAAADSTTGGTAAEADAKPPQPTAPATTPTQSSATSWVALGKAANTALGRRDLKRGMRGGDVRVLQQLLTELGYRVNASGRFDSRT